MNSKQITLFLLAYCMSFSYQILNASLNNKKIIIPKIIIPSERFMDTDDHSDEDIITAPTTNFLDQIKKVALTSSGNDAYNLDDIQTTNDYLIANDYEIIQHNIAIAQYIINSRGDGNCGYRSFLGSVFMNAHESDNAELFVHLHQLIDTKYINLFTQYDKQFSYNKPQVAREIKNYLNDQLAQLSEYTEIQEIHNHLNKEYAFVYYMIMFSRYLIVDHISHLNSNTIDSIINQKGDFIDNKDQKLFQTATEEERFLAYAIKDDKTTLAKYMKQILTWQDELTIDQSRLLALATGVTLYTISEEDQYQPLAVSKADPEFGIATIVYTPGHYRILIPTTQDPHDITTYFELNHFDDAHLQKTDQKNSLYTHLAIGAAAVTTVIVFSAIEYFKRHK